MFKKLTEEDYLCHDYTKEKLAEMYCRLKTAQTKTSETLDEVLDNLRESEKKLKEKDEIFNNADVLYKEIKARMSIDEYLALKNLFETDKGAQRTKVYWDGSVSATTNV